MSTFRYTNVGCQSREQFFIQNKLPQPKPAVKSTPNNIEIFIDDSTVKDDNSAQHDKTFYSKNFDTFRESRDHIGFKTTTPIITANDFFGLSATRKPTTSVEKIDPSDNKLDSRNSTPVLRSQVDQLNSQLQILRQENSTYKPLLSEANFKLAEAMRKNELLEQKLKEADSNRESMVNANTNFLQMQVQSLQEENKNSNEKIAKLIKDNQFIENSLNEYRVKLNEANRINNDLSQRILTQAANNNNGLLKNADERIEDLKAELERFQKSNYDLLNEKKNLDVSLYEKTQKLQEANRINEEQRYKISTLDSERKALEHQVMDLKRNLNDGLRQAELAQNQLAHYENNRSVSEPLVSEMKRRLIELEGENDHLKIKIRALESEKNINEPIFEQSQKKLQECYSVIDSLKTQVSELNREKTKQSPATEQLQHKLTETYETIERLKYELSAHEKEKSQSLINYIDAKQKADEAVAHLSELKSTVVVLRQNLEAKEAEISPLKQEVLLLQKAKEDLQSQIKLREEKIKVITKDLELKNNNLNDLKAEITDLKVNLDKMEIHIDRIPKLEKEIYLLEKERDALKQSNNAKTVEINNLKDKIIELSNKGEQNDLRNPSTANRQFGSGNLEAKIQELEQQVNQLKREKSDWQYHKSELEDAKQKVEYFQIKLNTLQSESSSMKQELQTYAALKADYKDLESQLITARDQINRNELLFKQKTEEYEKNRQHQKKKIEELESQLLRLQEDPIESRKGSVNFERSSSTRSESNTRSLEFEVKALKQKLANANEMISHLEALNSEKESAISDMRKRLTNANAQKQNVLTDNFSSFDNNPFKQSQDRISSQALNKPDIENNGLINDLKEELRNVRNSNATISEKYSQLNHRYNDVLKKLTLLSIENERLQAASKALPNTGSLPETGQSAFKKPNRSVSNNDLDLRYKNTSAHADHYIDDGVSINDHFGRTGSANVHNYTNHNNPLGEEESMKPSGLNALQESILETKNNEISKLRIERDRLMSYVTLYKQNTIELEEKVKLLIDRHENLKAKYKKLETASNDGSVRSSGGYSELKELQMKNRVLEIENQKLNQMILEKMQEIDKLSNHY